MFKSHPLSLVMMLSSLSEQNVFLLGFVHQKYCSPLICVRQEGGSDEAI